MMIMVVVVIITSCSYSVYQTAYPYLKSIRIETFENRTVEYTIEQELLDQLTKSFQSDGQLNIVEISPHCQLEGVILDYQNDVYSYDASGNVKEYMVKILFSVKLTDFVKNQVLWENEALLLKEPYLTQENSTSSGSEALTEEGARVEIYKDLYDAVLENTFQAW